MTRTFEGLTKAQTDLLGRIAIGLDGLVNERTVAVLMERGLVERVEVREGMYTTYRYIVPLPVHMRWAYWCAHPQQEATR